MLLVLHLNVLDDLDWVRPAGEIGLDESGVSAIAVSPDGELVAIVHPGLGHISVRAWTDASQLAWLDTSESWDAAVFSADSRRIFTTAGARRKGAGIPGVGTLGEFHPLTGKFLNEQAWLHRGIDSITTLPDNRLLAIGMGNGEVALVRMLDLRKERSVRQGTYPVSALHCSPDGTCIASAGGGHICVIDIRGAGEPVIDAAFPGWSCAFSPDSQRIAVWREQREGERGIGKIEIRTVGGKIESSFDSDDRAANIAWLRADAIATQPRRPGAISVREAKSGHHLGSIAGDHDKPMAFDSYSSTLVTCGPGPVIRRWKILKPEGD